MTTYVAMSFPPETSPATHPFGPDAGPSTAAEPPPSQYYHPTAAELYQSTQHGPPASPGADALLPGGPGLNHYPSVNGALSLPRILQVEKQQVTTSATQLASASRRRNEAHFICPVPGCGSTFTRRFNLRGHLRSHTEERPYICEWPNCKKGFARQHDCKRHQALHTAKTQTNVCVGCKKTFSRLDALNRHMRSDGGAECRAVRDQMMQGVAEEPKAE
ncbi:hypothetical protein MIND_00065500 [Mycena indigotica]|uniref:C2H2-type domain-containing protein n=1 Tax=Mycena indigotica TaxID=2126181 RepID=A0A8H6TEW6_9AGAR|nr:uncharacterized protein MIND_00065500 [Mycena indigotica]KAF7315502.1 hypothetical protein MIND_00065500 [Mycena indigotica]